ncbi:CoA-binding domain protein [Thermodesulfobium narugense DSM 14796]|uniref:CoA-binding domain protein n=1 Tax=Thermodesulfobium narugense DSM 14796 TaxID=747365 RepID=M1E4C3_9BACT|nr:acetate--CoA ligase family protein [Thermodesulfobium narugense]AEE13987.1 CoA-binding domain protein [Thermodesulfobium narugense DSM 14796]
MDTVVYSSNGNREKNLELDFFFNPRNVAVLGASRKPGSVGYTILENLLDFKGQVFPINPNATEILGMRAYASLQDLFEPIDLAIISVPREIVPIVLEDAGRAGCLGAVIVTSGFKEVGRKDLEDQLLEIARKYSMRIIGPNCLGIYDAKSRLDTSFLSKQKQARPGPGNIAFLSQSGAFLAAIMDWAASEKIGISKGISYGNKVDVNELDLIDYLIEDDDTEVICLYIEGVDEPRVFFEKASIASKKKPILIMKSGLTEEGTKAAASHTGSMAGSGLLFKSACKQAGLIMVKDYRELFNAAKALVKSGPVTGNRIAILTNGGGAGVMTTDYAMEKSFKMANLSDSTKEKLKSFLPVFASVNNPVDITGSGTEDDFVKSLKVIQADENVDAVLGINLIQVPGMDEKIVNVLPAEIVTSSKPYYSIMIGGNYTNKVKLKLEKKGMLVYNNIIDCVDSLYISSLYTSLREKDSWSATDSSLKVSKKAKAITSKALKSKETSLIEPNLSEFLNDYKMPLSQSYFFASVEDILNSKGIIFPGVAKVVSCEIIHKTDAGGVILGIKSKEELVDAYKKIVENAKKYDPTAKVRGISYQKMEKKGVELIVGGFNDKYFGPVVMFGLGGIYVEVLKDVVFAIAPITTQIAMSMMKELKSYKILTGVRGEDPVDQEKIAELLVRFSQILYLHPEIKEMEFNPVFAYKDSVVIVDSRILLSK